MSEKRRFLKTEGLKIDQLTFEWFINTKIFLCPIVRKKRQRLQNLVMKILKFLKDGSKNFEIVMQDITFKCKNP
jgi:hypothetical protein